MIERLYKGIRTVEREYAFNDIAAKTDHSEGFFAENNELTAAPSVKKTGELKRGLKCVKIYDAGFPVYYCSDGKLYREKNGEIKAYGIPATSAPPYVFELICDGEKTVAAACGSGTYLLNDGISFIAMPKGVSYFTYKGSLFIAKGRKILVCGDAEYAGDGISIATKNFLMPEGRYGAVVKLLCISDELYAFCQRGAVKITLTGEEMEYAISDCGLPPFKCIPDSVAAMGNEAYFINIDGLCRFNGKRIEKIPSFFDKKHIEPCGEATAKDNYYLLPVNVGGKRKIYCFDVLSYRETFIEGEGIVVAGGKTASFITGETGEIETTESARIWKSVKTDFGRKGEKTLSVLYIDSDADAEISVNGDGVERTFPVKSGEREVPLSVRAEKFVITVAVERGGGEDKISDISVKYRI